MITDLITQTLQAIEYILLLVTPALLWWTALRRLESRFFWRLLALGWTMNLLGNIAWAIHDFATGTTLDTFSAVDLFYVSRYILIGIALWFYPTPLTRRDGAWVGVMAFIVNAIVWAVYFDPAMKLRNGNGTDYLGLALYPVLDAAIITTAGLRFRAARGSSWDRNLLFLLYAMISYGIANTLNLGSYIFSSTTGGALPSVFWLLTDILVWIMVLNRGMKKDDEK